MKLLEKIDMYLNEKVMSKTQYEKKYVELTKKIKKLEGKSKEIGGGMDWRDAKRERDQLDYDYRDYDNTKFGEK